MSDENQAQTAAVFGYKWAQRETFDRPEALARFAESAATRYGDLAGALWWGDYGTRPVVLDAGCGAAMTALALLRDRLRRVHYIGVDISEAVNVASVRFAEAGIDASFVRADIARLPLRERSVDVILSEGVLHHTPSTQDSLAALVHLLRPGGRICFYVYRRKGPIREFTDDYIRSQLRMMPPADAWSAIIPLTRLGQVLGQLDIDIEIPEPIALLELPAGRINLQRFFYWHICKAYYDPQLSLDELAHINFDWFAPAYAHRHTPGEVRHWCGQLGLEIEHEDVQGAGITVIGRKLA